MTKLCGKTYCWGAPTGVVAVRSIVKHRPDLSLTGITAMQVSLGMEISLPIHVAVKMPQRLASTEHVVAHRTRTMRQWFYKGAFLADAPTILAHSTDDELSIKYLESSFGGRDGQELLERHCFGRTLSAKARRLISTAAIGADSPPERTLIKLLRRANLAVTSNVKIGDYFWDIKLDKYRILIEIDGFQYHAGGQENQQAFARDRWKGNDGALRGFLVLRYAAKCIENVPDKVVSQIQLATKNWRPGRVLVDETADGNLGVWKWHPLFKRYVPGML